ncbi:MAG: oligopeptide/dipeptide ABC transporter ATP-binding protein [Verrucomicrobiota bacterium]
MASVNYSNGTTPVSTFGYDRRGLVYGVTNGSDRATYRYVAGVNSALVQDRIMRHNNSVINASARIYDRLNRLTSLVATTPSPIHPPAGGPFHLHCAMAEARCRTEVPVLRELTPGHWVSCHLCP